MTKKFDREEHIKKHKARIAKIKESIKNRKILADEKAKGRQRRKDKQNEG